MFGILVSFWDDLCSGAMLVSGKVCLFSWGFQVLMAKLDGRPFFLPAMNQPFGVHGEIVSACIVLNTTLNFFPFQELNKTDWSLSTRQFYLKYFMIHY